MRGGRATKRAHTAALLAAAWLLGPLSASAGDPGEADDPWEGFNRSMFWFNEEVLLRYLVRPAAKGWDFVMPDPFERGITNVLENAAHPVILVNDLLQLRFEDAAVTTGRFVLNTMFGMGGLFDPAEVTAGWIGHKSDFAQTLGVWGIPAGPYLVLPVLGPSSPREFVGNAADRAGRVWPFFVPIYVSFAVSVPEYVHTYAQVMDELDAERAQAFDYYVFVRNAYVQHRQELVERGSGEAEPDDGDDLYYPDDDLYYPAEDGN